MAAIDWNYTDDKTRQLAQQQQMSPRQQAYFKQVAQYNAAQSPQQRALAGMDPSQRFFSGVGGGMTSLVEGVKQRMGKASQDEIDDFRDNYDPLVNTREGSIGSMVGQTALTLPTMLIPGANTMVGSALIGTGLGALQPTRQGESVAHNMKDGAIGGITGHFIGQGVGATAKFARNKIGQLMGGEAAQDAGQQAAQQGARQSGSAAADASPNPASPDFSNSVMKSTPGRANDSGPLTKLEKVITPLTNTAKTENSQAFQNVIKKEIGSNDPNFDSGTITRAFKKAQGAYDVLPDAGTQAIDGQAIDASLQDIDAKYGHLFKPDVESITQNRAVQDLQKLGQNGSADTGELANVGKKLTEAIGQQSKENGSRPFALALGEAKKMVDDMIQPNLSGDAADNFAASRAKSENLIKIADPALYDPVSGGINPDVLDATLTNLDPDGYLGGGNQSDLYNAARFAVDPANQSIISGAIPKGNTASSIVAAPFSYLYGSKPSVYLARALGALRKAPGSETGEALLRPAVTAASTQPADPNVGSGSTQQAVSDDTDADATP